LVDGVPRVVDFYPELIVIQLEDCGLITNFPSIHGEIRLMWHLNYATCDESSFNISDVKSHFGQIGRGIIQLRLPFQSKNVVSANCITEPHLIQTWIARERA